MGVITEDRLRYLAGRHGFNLIYLEKDYFLTLLLYMIKDIRGIYFKGGTCLNKVFLSHTRLSEDLDFASARPIERIGREMEKSIDRKIFHNMETDKSTADFVRYKINFRGYFQKTSHIILDVNKKASVHLNPEIHAVKNFYGLRFRVQTLKRDEIVAEKIRALITRNQPRDYFDAYFILKKYPVNMKLLKSKMKEAGEEWDTERIFRNANRVYSKWESDLLPLTSRKVDFLTVIKFLEDRVR